MADSENTEGQSSSSEPHSASKSTEQTSTQRVAEGVSSAVSAEKIAAVQGVGEKGNAPIGVDKSRDFTVGSAISADRITKIKVAPKSESISVAPASDTSTDAGSTQADNAAIE